jgi:cell wall-associated NlpC family hydrolase
MREDMLRSVFARLTVALIIACAVAAPAVCAPQSYTVSAGDTLSSIAQREHVAQSQLVRLNHLGDADFLREGQVLIVKPQPVRSAKRTAHLAGHKSAAARTRRVAHATTANTKATMAQHQALWVAMHTGVSAPDLSGMPSFATAQRMVSLELRLTQTALRYIGVPYVFGGESFSGMDCSGFVQAVFHRNGIELPRTADAQYEVGRQVSTARLEPGDLVFFQTYTEGASHVGIYLGNGRFVHASSSNGVRVDSLSETYYSSRYLGARRAAI